MRVAVVTFDGFNELDSFIAAHIINRVDLPGWRACSSTRAVSGSRRSAREHSC